VIGPDPTLKMGQLAVPMEMASNLTVPVRVAKFNYDYLTKLVNAGGANYVLKNEGKTRINLNYALFRKGTELIFGDEIHRKRDGKVVIINVRTGKEKLMVGDRVKRGNVFLEEIKYPEKKSYKLEMGDVVERKLQNGDIVLLNRQPTLWKGK
jgi:DNA-directed RNA polymerase beta' subunit